MDPDETLRKAQLSAAAVADALDGNGDLLAVAEDLAEQFQALDEWLSKGGFLPAAWEQVLGPLPSPPEPLGPPNPADGHLPEHHEEEANG